jgi:hypothetical protein
MAWIAEEAVVDSGTKQLQARLTVIEARLKALADADDNASWGRPAAMRGGFRHEPADLMQEAERIIAQLRSE